MWGWEEEVQCPAEDVSKFVCSSDRIIKVSRPINIIFKLLAQHFAPRRQAIDISPVCLARVYKIYSWIILKQDFWMNTITLAPCRNHLFFCCLYKTQELKISTNIFLTKRQWQWAFFCLFSPLAQTPGPQQGAAVKSSHLLLSPLVLQKVPSVITEKAPTRPVP